MSKKLLGLIILFFCFNLFAEDNGTKKLIHYGWSWVRPDFLVSNLDMMEKQTPFYDGLCIRFEQGDDPFIKEKFNYDNFKNEIELLKEAKFKVFKDNFIAAMIMSIGESWDWFNEQDIETATYNFGLLAKMAKDTGCKGLLIDPEVYCPREIWNYEKIKGAKEKTYDEYYEQVRKAGREIMSAIQKEYPDIKLFFLFLNSIFYDSVFNNEEELKKILVLHRYGLLPAFLNGILDVTNAEVTIIDGSEISYWWRNHESFYYTYHNVHQGALSLIAPENREKYRKQIQISFGIFPDYYYGIYLPIGVLPEGSAKWYENNIYYGLKVADEYVWDYGEKRDWWGIQKNTPWFNSVFEGSKEAIISAKRKIEKREPLGFNIQEVFSRLRTVTTDIKKIQKMILIDGKLEDFVSEEIKKQISFIGPLPNPKIQAETKAWVGYDENNLYVCFYCEEPYISKMNINKFNRDDDRIWMNDCVEVFISNPYYYPYYHFIVSPSNAQWDGIKVLNNNEAEDKKWDGKWDSGVYIGDNFWTVEIAIPWENVSKQIKEGDRIRINFGRYRTTGIKEISTWSQIISLFGEPEHFGLIVIK